MKTILILGTAYPYRGGLAAYNERIAAEFITQGHSVQIITFTLQYPSFLFPGATQYSSEPAPKKILIHRKINAINPFNWIKVGWLIKKQRPDIVLIKYWLPFMGPCFGTIARIAKSNKHTNIISIIDNIIPHEKRPFDTLFTKYFTASVHRFISMSSSVQRDLKRHFYRTSALVPHPIYDNYGSKINKQTACDLLQINTQKYLLFFGIIRKYKGLDLLLEAMADKRLEAFDIHLIVAGEYYDDAAYYQQIIEKKQLQNRVLLHTHFIPDSQVAQYFGAADLVVQPYRNATQSGITQMAYHFETPMIVTNVGGLQEMVQHEHTGYVCKANSQSIADAIFRFYTDLQAEQLTNNVAEQKKQYSWKRMTDAVLNDTNPT